MRKAVFFLLISLICISFYHLANAFPDGIPLSSYQFKTTEVTLTNSVIGEIVYLPTNSFEEKDAIYMINNLQKIDPNILMLAAEQSIQIKLFTGSLTEQDGLNRLKNLKPRGYSDAAPDWELVPGMSDDRVVYAKLGHSKFGMGHGSVSLELHEVAHAIDRYVFHYVRKDPIFINIWRQEVNELFPLQNYFIQFPEEYFAEIFAMYYYNDENRLKLKEDAPLSYRYIQSLEKQAAIQQQNLYVNLQY